ncbi:hypothetical protein QTL95_22760 [Rhizobium sp. S152]|uniref:hypothetical protein n=1 Tax=Rhizobium sp. S152 TaxID=3055038 RepID=UPI0025A9E2B1|nr:hypothetical protein [Rhizobium sp. S152]MDM9628719.1 hypothetical protein [Rhizobium sp. S152]
MRRSLPFIIALAATSSVAFAGTSGPDVGLTSKLTSCVGKFAAAVPYESYVPGQQQSRADAALALRKLLPSDATADMSVYIAAVNDAKASYEPELVRDPMNTTRIIRALMEECNAYATQALKSRSVPNQRVATGETANNQ